MPSGPAIITGITGQDGSLLAEFISAREGNVVGVARCLDEVPDYLKALIQQTADRDAGRVSLVTLDLLSADAVGQLFEHQQPCEVYHLAAQSHVGKAIIQPVETTIANAAGTTLILEALRKHSPATRFFHASSAEIFASADEGVISETSACHPRNPYGFTKAFATQMTDFYRHHHKLFTVNGICFNHESSRRGPDFVTQKIVRCVAEISVGLRQEFDLGNLDSQRDWGAAQDFVRGMWLSLQADHPDNYVFCTGQLRSVREFCEIAFEWFELPIQWSGNGLDEVGIDSNGVVRVRINPDFFRTTETPPLQGSSQHAKACLGWEPEVTFPEMVAEMCLSAQKIASSQA